MGFAEMPMAISTPGLSPVERLVLAAVAEHSNAKQGWTMFWGQKRIAEQLGVSDRAVRSAYKVLEERGFISRTSRHVPDGEGRRRSTDTIRFNVQAVRDAQRQTSPKSGGHKGVPEMSSASGGSEFRSMPEVSSAHNREDEHVSEQVRGFTSTAAASDADVSHQQPISGTPGRKAVLDVMQAVARADVDEQCFVDAVRLHYGDELADFAEHRFSTVPGYCTNRYKAGERLTKLLNTARREICTSVEPEPATIPVEAPTAVRWGHNPSTPDWAAQWAHTAA